MQITREASTDSRFCCCIALSGEIHSPFRRCGALCNIVVIVAYLVGRVLLSLLINDFSLHAAIAQRVVLIVVNTQDKSLLLLLFLLCEEVSSLFHCSFNFADGRSNLCCATEGQAMFEIVKVNMKLMTYICMCVCKLLLKSKK